MSTPGNRHQQNSMALVHRMTSVHTSTSISLQSKLQKSAKHTVLNKLIPLMVLTFLSTNEAACGSFT